MTDKPFLVNMNKQTTMTITNFTTSPYKGTRDFYPEQLLKRNYIFETWKKTLISFGFAQYETSLLENAELYVAKSGEELGAKQLYRFEDKGGRLVALRPEQTPSLARIVAKKYTELRFPLRWFSIPNCFRYERPQKGRLREHWQLNVDILGLNAGEVELEILYLLAEIFKSFGANKNHFKIDFNSRTLLDSWLEQENLLETKSLIYSVLDDWYKKPLEENLKLLKNPDSKLSNKGLNENQIQKILELTKKKGPYWEKYLSLANQIPEIKLILENLSTIQPEIEYDLNPCIIRGIAYYTGLVFEAFDKNPDNPRALGGGGRYDNLMELFIEKKVPALGFGIGDVTFYEFLENWKLLEGYKLFDDWKKVYSSFKVGIMPFQQNQIPQIFTEIIPELKSQNHAFEIDYDFSRNPKKRYESLKKRGCDEILKL